MRLKTCPGHDDEGGRAWCAFCGDLPRVEATIPLRERCRHKTTSHIVDDEERRECMEFSCACEQFETPPLSGAAWDGKCAICREPMDLNATHVCARKGS